MTLVNIDPHVILHQKMYVPFTGIFVGRSNGPPAPCVSFRRQWVVESVDMKFLAS